MKNTFLACLALACSATQTFAQNLDACDGTRYRTEVFASTKRTTVQFATAKSYTGGILNLMADVYEPVGDAATKRPVIVVEHGGSFIAGTRGDMAATCDRLAKRGYVVATIDYRLYPVFVLGYPDSLKIMDAAFKGMADFKAAVRFFRKDAATDNKYHVDPNNIFIAGYSAGAVAALHYAYMDNADVLPAYLQGILTANGGYHGDSGDAANQSYPDDVKFVASMSGGLYRSNWVNPGQPQMCMIHGTADDIVPFVSGLAANIAYLQGSSLVDKAATAAGVNHYFEVVTGGDHVNMYTSATYAPNVTSFFDHASAMMEEIICGPAATGEVLGSQKLAWSLAPNPNNGAFQVQLPEGMNEATVLVFNNLGQKIWQQEKVAAGEMLRLPNVRAGIFTVQILDGQRPGVVFPLRQVVVE